MKMRMAMAALGVAGVALLTACEPQLELGLIMRRDATLLSGSTGSLVTLYGTLYCNRDISNREPVDLFVTIEQYPDTLHGQAGDLDCHGPEGTDFNREFRSDVRLEPGSARLRVEACTNPSQSIDEDCVTVERVIVLN